MATPALAVEHLDLAYRTDEGMLRALRDVSLEVAPGEIVGIVGESGCGKSSLIQAILRLMPANAVIERGRIALAGTDLLGLDAEPMRRLRGDRISVVFQDPMTALNPVLSIGRQMMDIQYRRGGSQAVDLQSGTKSTNDGVSMSVEVHFSTRTPGCAAVVSGTARKM